MKFLLYFLKTVGMGILCILGLVLAVGPAVYLMQTTYFYLGFVWIGLVSCLVTCVSSWDFKENKPFFKE